MEQNFLFIHKNYQEIFTVRTDKIDEEWFENNTKNWLLNIVKKNDIKGKFKLVNLYNGLDKKYKAENLHNIQLGGFINDDKSENFNKAWQNINTYVNENIKNDNMDEKHVSKLYHNLLNSGQEYNIHKDEINKMFLNLLSQY